VTEGQGVSISEEKSGLEGVDDQGFERLAEEHVIVQTKGSGREGADDCAEVSTRRGCLRQESRDEPSEAGPRAQASERCDSSACQRRSRRWAMSRSDFHAAVW